MNYAGERDENGWWVTVATADGTVQLGYDTKLHTYYAAAFDHDGYYAGVSLGGDAHEIPTPEALTAALATSGQLRDLRDDPALLEALRAAQATT